MGVEGRNQECAPDLCQRSVQHRSSIRHDSLDYIHAFTHTYIHTHTVASSWLMHLLFDGVCDVSAGLQSCQRGCACTICTR